MRGGFGVTVALTEEVSALVAAHAPVAIGVSGGKDSCAVAFATVEYLDRIGHAGPRLLIHSDLGSVEWQDSLPTCERLAERLGLELVTVRRAAGGMMERWRQRWANNAARYRDLLCVRTILPWSTASMRFCTSELKSAVIAAELRRRYPGRAILSVSGIRREESARRAKAPVAKPQPRLTGKTAGTSGLDWNPILDWTLGDVLACLAARDFRLHEAYTRFGSSRVSCAFCILGSAADLRASAACPDNAGIYREMVALEIESAFAFRQDQWLGDVAPALLDGAALVGLAFAKDLAREREAIEAAIPEHLLYTKGWPTVMPTPEEAELLAGVRRRVARLYHWSVSYDESEAVLGRYAELMRLNAERFAKKGDRP